MKIRSALVLGLLLGAATAAAQVETVPTGSFRFQFTVALPGAPEAVFDAATGDISGWWDHSMSGAPVALTIDPTPGGFFLEVMDADGGGVVHAVGEVHEGWGLVVEQTWRHFIEGRLLPFLQAGGKG